MFRRFRRLSIYLGPAFVAAIAYVDPGNFAANFSAGAEYGYTLLWVLVVANIMAMLVQYLSAKLGIVTGKSLPEVIASKLSRKYRIAFWLQAEVVAIATDLAEVVGGAIALNIIFGVPLLAGAVITGIVSMALLLLYNKRDIRIYEYVITGLLLVIPIGFFTGLAMRPPDVHLMAEGLLPTIQGPEVLLLVAAMFGATVMPHVVYLHSAIARDKHKILLSKTKLEKLLRATKIDVGLAMVFAGTVNIAMLLLAASALRGHPDVDTLEGIYAVLNSDLSTFVGGLFGVGLLASGFASTAVGGHAGAVIMEGMLHKHIALHWRRLITIIPAILIVAVGVDATYSLILSQVVLSFGIPFALIPLVMTTSSRSVMGKHVNKLGLTIIIGAVTSLIVILNVALIYLVATGVAV